MKLRFFSSIMQIAESVIAALHWIERQVCHVRVWAWTRCTKENLKTCNSRAASRL
jgi:hypothetical protein